MKNLKWMSLATIVVLSLVNMPVQADTFKVIVRYQSQDLTSEAGIHGLYGRLVAAAHNVCGEREMPGSRLVSPAWQRCVRDAVDAAVTQVDSRALYAYHDRQMQRPVATSS